MRVSFEWILYYLQLTFVGIFVLVLCAYQMEVKQKDFLKRGMYSDHVQGMQLSSTYLSSAHGETVDFSIPRLDGGDFMIYKRLSEEYNEIVRGVYGTKDLFTFLPICNPENFFKKEITKIRLLQRLLAPLCWIEFIQKMENGMLGMIANSWKISRG